MKKSMIIGKRQIVLAVLVLALGAAVYLNWRFADAGGTLEVGSTSSSQSKGSIGDAKFVNQTSSSAPKTSFTAARQDRENARNDAVALLKEVLTDKDADTSAKASATDKIAQLAKNIEAESSVETLVKAKGFADCVAVINDDKVNVIVPAPDDGLLESEVLQIQDIVMGQVKVTLDNIYIVPVK